MSEAKTHWPQPVLRVRTVNQRTTFVQVSQWEDGTVKLREMQANGWPRQFHISRKRILGVQP